MRELKHHERKLLKKVDFVQWKSDQSTRENAILKRYHIPVRDDYVKYNRLCGQIRKIASKLAALEPTDPYRIQATEQMLDKLDNMGLLGAKRSLAHVAKLAASSFCRRRLPVVMMRLHMAETIKEAVVLVEQGHVRVGTDVVRDPALLINRTMEDFVTWADNSKIKRHIMKYNDKLDDYDLLGN